MSQMMPNTNIHFPNHNNLHHHSTNQPIRISVTSSSKLNMIMTLSVNEVIASFSALSGGFSSGKLHAIPGPDRPGGGGIAISLSLDVAYLYLTLH